MKRRAWAILIAVVFAVTVSTGVLSLPETTIFALYHEPKIEVVVPSTGEMLLNPKSLPVEFEGKVQWAQILHVPWSIENRSEVGIKVDAKVHGEVAKGSSIELCEYSVGNYRGEDKRVFMYLDMKVTDPDVNLRDDIDWTETVFNRRKHIVVTEYEEERENIMTLAPANLDGTVAKGGVGAFHLNGNATPDPWDEWVPGIDRVTVKIVFTFRPTRYVTGT